MIHLGEFIGQYSGILILLGVFVLLGMGIVFLKWFVRQNQKNRELTRAAADKVRDENLNNAILNHCARGETKEVYKPYDVDYSNMNDDADKSIREFPKESEVHTMIQLVEKTELSTRKFMLNPAQKIRIGSELHDNDISVLAEGISLHQCEIFSVRNRVYLRSLSPENKTIIRRKKIQAIVDEKGVRLLSNDIIILGRVSYDITIMN